MNKQIQFYYLSTWFHYFWKKVKTSRKHFEITWPLALHIIWEIVLWKLDLIKIAQRQMCGKIQIFTTSLWRCKIIHTRFWIWDSCTRNNPCFFSEIMFEVELDKIVIDRHTICVFPKSPQFKLRATTLKLLICLEKRWICQINLHLKELSARREKNK
jgi:hypothetical protein